MERLGQIILSIIGFFVITSCMLMCATHYRPRQPERIFNDLSPRFTVVATTYNALIAQTDSTPFLTASGFVINPRTISKDRTLAVSRDLLQEFYYGDTVMIDGTGVYDGAWIVRDCMNKRFTNKVDFLVTTKQPLGRWDSVFISRK